MTDSVDYSFSTQIVRHEDTTIATPSTGESSSSSTTVATTSQISSPDDSDGLSAEVGGSAIATGEDTLAAGSILGELIDGGAVTSVSLSATMVAASEDSGGETADAWTHTSASVSEGAEGVFGYTIDTQSSEQDPTGSTATSTSTTGVVAYDLQLDNLGTGGSTAAPDAGGDPSGGSDQLGSSPTPTDVGDAGNVAILEFDILVEGEDTFASVDAFAFTVEDELSITDGYAILMVD